MKFNFRNILLYTVGACAIAASSFTLSCNIDKCKTIVCANKGVCNNGICTCPTGWEGPNCETEARKKFTGNWSVFEKGTGSLAKQYQVKVENSVVDNELSITNFNNFFHSPVTAYIKSDTLFIPIQHLEGKIIYGDGYFDPGTTYDQYAVLKVRYMVIDSATLKKDDYGYESHVDFSDPSQWNK